MKKLISVLFILALVQLNGISQTIESIVKDLPPYFSILTTWGLRPEWDEKGEA